jgi:hypothetical protein
MLLLLVVVVVVVVVVVTAEVPFVSFNVEGLYACAYIRSLAAKTFTRMSAVLLLVVVEEVVVDGCWYSMYRLNILGKKKPYVFAGSICGCLNSPLANGLMPEFHTPAMIKYGARCLHISSSVVGYHSSFLTLDKSQCLSMKDFVVSDIWALDFGSCIVYVDGSTIATEDDDVVVVVVGIVGFFVGGSAGVSIIFAVGDEVGGDVDDDDASLGIVSDDIS